MRGVEDEPRWRPIMPGHNTSIDKMLDFIQETFYHSRNEGCSSTAFLKDMGFPEEQIDAAIKACGKECEIDVLVEFIRANPCFHGSFASIRNEVSLLLAKCQSYSSVLEKDVHLKDMGFAAEHVKAAIEACGKESSIDELVDFIEAHFCMKRDEVSPPLPPQGCWVASTSTHEMDSGAHQKETKEATRKAYGEDSSVRDDIIKEVEENDNEFGVATQLLEMGCSSEQVAHAIRLCGKDTSIGRMLDCIQETFHHSQNERLAPSDLLRSMGFSAEHINAAMKACAEDMTFVGEERSINDLVEFIWAHFFAKDSYIPKKDKVFVPLPGECMASPETLEDHWSRRLGDMGFPEEHIKTAIQACGKHSCFEDAVEYAQALSGIQDSPSLFLEEVESFEKDDVTSFQELREMGFSSSAIQNAMETCESLDVDDLLACLLEAEQLCEEEVHMQDGFQGAFNYELEMMDEAGPSKPLANIDWQLWYSYIGIKKDCFSAPDGSTKKTKRLSTEKVPDLERRKGTTKKGGLKLEVVAKSLRPDKMRGFGTPGYYIGRRTPVPHMMAGPPFFYFENVAGTPKSEWDTIKRHLHDVEIEFTDSMFFSASRRPRGYVHNLPVHGRRLIIPEPPMTIAAALPSTQTFWPWWDTREKLNCINTRRASDSLCSMVRTLCEAYDVAEMPPQRQQEIIQASKKWNLVWVGPGEVGPLKPEEIELLLGFDRDHTRGCTSLSERHAALGNSFQINTVAYHLSPLRDLFPYGMTVLSLFSGIGGAEVALHKLGIHLNTVIAVEKHSKPRNVLVTWWKKSGQKGRLNTDVHDVRDLSYEVLVKLIDDVGPIDLVIGGSPCNNLSGCNRVTRTGLSGVESSLFFEFPRILNIVKQVMAEKCQT